MSDDRFAEVLSERYLQYQGYAAQDVATRCGVGINIDGTEPRWRVFAFAHINPSVPTLANIKMPDVPMPLCDHLIFHEMGHVFLIRSRVRHACNYWQFDVAQYNVSERAIDRFAVAMLAATEGLFVKKESLPKLFSRGECRGEYKRLDLAEVISQVVAYFEFTPSGILAMSKLAELVHVEQWAEDKSAQAKS